MSRFDLYLGDCLDTLKKLPDNSVDSVVTDPPYGLSFMGKRWDYDVPSVEVWAECFRVLKPGGHLLAFAGTRTQHRMAVRIEDAGLEIRDMLAWVYSSGFPKSGDLTDEMEHYLRHGPTGPIDPRIYLITQFLKEQRNLKGWTNRQIDELFGTRGMAGHWTTQASQPACPSLKEWAVLKEALGFEDSQIYPLVMEFCATNNTGKGVEAQFLKGLKVKGRTQSYGTALKPALEPLTLARKPFKGTTKGNVLQHGTGALNIDGARVGERWPANLLHDGGPEVEDCLGSAARFFYCAKASKKDRGPDNRHPTVKPTELMRYLCRLVTPPGGTVLDPFMGSGSTGKAAMLEGFRFIGCELDPDYLEIARARIEAARESGK